MRRFWIWPLLLAILVAGCGPEPERPAPAPATRLPPAAARLLSGLELRQKKLRGFCLLAGKAAPVFPELARRYAARGLALAVGLDPPGAAQTAATLERDGHARASARLRELAGAGWPLRLVAEAALSVDAGTARRALDLGLERVAAGTDPEAAVRDLPGLVAVLARLDPVRARRLAAKIASPLARSRCFLNLARLANSRDDLEAAQEAAERVADAGDRALALAACARLLHEFAPPAARALFERAWRAAGGLGARRAELVRGRLAADLAALDPAAGLELAGRLTGGLARFMALRRATVSLLATEPGAGRKLLVDCLRAAEDLGLDYQRHKAYALLAGDLAQLDPRRAGEILAAVPKAEYLLRAEPRAAMVLAEAGRGLQRARRRARRITDPVVRLMVMIRLAAIKAKADPARGRQWYRQTAREALADGVQPAIAALAEALAANQARVALDLAQALANPTDKVRVLFTIARTMDQKGRTAAAVWAMQLALETVNSINSQQILDKARLLGDMGRVWSVNDPDRASRFFKIGARLIEETN